MRLPQPPKTELEHRFEKRRLSCSGRAAADVGGWSEQHEIDEVAACNREVGDLGGGITWLDSTFSVSTAVAADSDTDTLCFTAAMPSWTSTMRRGPGQRERLLIFVKPSALTVIGSRPG